MEANVEFYADWFSWLEKRTAEMAHGAPLNLLALTSEVAALLKGEVALWKSLGGIAHGSPLSIALHFGQWVSQHPDPLKDTREQMRAIRAKYGEVDAK